MKTYYVELTKTICIPFEADSEKDAIELATEDDSGFDGAWERAEPHGTIVYIEEVSE